MTIENKFRTYLAAFDGINTDYSTVSSLFDDIYHDDFDVQGEECNIGKEQMKLVHKNALAQGSKATILYMSSQDSTFEFKFRMTGPFDLVIHNYATIKDGKIFQARIIEEGTHMMMLRLNAETYFNTYDGKPKDISTVSHLFEKVYHDDIAYCFDGKSINKQGLKEVQANFFKLGSKATLLMFKTGGHDQVEYKFRMVNDLVDVVVHNVSKVKDNKFVESRPVDAASTKAISKVHEVHHLCDTANGIVKQNIKTSKTSEMKQLAASSA